MEMATILVPGKVEIPELDKVAILALDKAVTLTVGPAVAVAIKVKPSVSM